MRKMLRGEFGAFDFVDVVLDELDFMQRFGRYPPGYRDTRPQQWRGSARHRELLLRGEHRRTYERWSTRLTQDARRCDDCHRSIGKGGGAAPMLHDEIWASIAAPLDYLCDRCCRRRLGRPYTLRDFRVCMFNVDRFRWLDGAPWAGPLPAVNMDMMPDGFYDFEPLYMSRMKKLVQGVALHFGIPVEVAALSLEVKKREIQDELMELWARDNEDNEDNEYYYDDNFSNEED